MFVVSLLKFAEALPSNLNIGPRIVEIGLGDDPMLIRFVLLWITFGSKIMDSNRRELLTIIARRGLTLSIFQAYVRDVFAIEVWRSGSYGRLL